MAETHRSQRFGTSASRYGEEAFLLASLHEAHGIQYAATSIWYPIIPTLSSQLAHLTQTCEANRKLNLRMACWTWKHICGKPWSISSGWWLQDQRATCISARTIVLRKHFSFTSFQQLNRCRCNRHPIALTFMIFSTFPSTSEQGWAPPLAAKAKIIFASLLPPKISPVYFQDTSSKDKFDTHTPFPSPVLALKPSRNLSYKALSRSKPRAHQHKDQFRGSTLVPNCRDALIS